jgi:hypothetical protein
VHEQEPPVQFGLGYGEGPLRGAARRRRGHGRAGAGQLHESAGLQNRSALASTAIGSPGRDRAALAPPHDLQRALPVRGQQRHGETRRWRRACPPSWAHRHLAEMVTAEPQGSISLRTRASGRRGAVAAPGKSKSAGSCPRSAWSLGRDGHEAAEGDLDGGAGRQAHLGRIGALGDVDVEAPVTNRLARRRRSPSAGRIRSRRRSLRAGRRRRSRRRPSAPGPCPRGS